MKRKSLVHVPLAVSNYSRSDSVQCRYFPSVFRNCLPTTGLQVSLWQRIPAHHKASSYSFTLLHVAGLWEGLCIEERGEDMQTIHIELGVASETHGLGAEGCWLKSLHRPGCVCHRVFNL